MNFDTLSYFLDQNHMIASAESELGGSLVIDYMPLKDGRIERSIRITAGHVEAFFYESDAGDLELSSLSATQGVSCDDDGSRRSFDGSNLLYDHALGVMTVTGSEDMPCELDGTPVEGVEYNLRTRSLKASPIAPGAIQLNQ